MACLYNQDSILLATASCNASLAVLYEIFSFSFRFGSMATKARFFQNGLEVHNKIDGLVRRCRKYTRIHSLGSGSDQAAEKQHSHRGHFDPFIILRRCFKDFIRISFSQTFFHSLLAADVKTASQTLAVSRASRKVGWHGSPLVSEARKSAT